MDPRALDSVMRAVDFAETRLGDGIGLSEMAEAACYSPFYFSRLFARASGHAPYDYLMRRRTAVAAERVTGSGEDLTGIALDCGFGAPDAFARAFRRCFGLAPSEARKAGSYPRSTARTMISRAYASEALARPFAPPTEEILEERIMIDAGNLPPRKAAVFEIAGRGDRLECLNAFRGVEAGDGAVMAARYPAISTILPPGRYARFAVDDSEERLAFTLEYAYRAWVPASGAREPPRFDIVERIEGKPRALRLYLGPA